MATEIGGITMKAVVLARGLGTRMQRADASAALTAEQARAADAGIKAMMPVGRPFLDYGLSALADAGVTRICLVVAPDHETLSAYYEARIRRISLTYAVQREPKGTAAALLAARGFAGNDPFLVLNADNYYPSEVVRTLASSREPAVAGFDREALVRLGNIDAERIRRYALLRVDPEGFLEDIVEKPDDAEFAAMGEHALVSMNLWSFSAPIFEACARVPPSPRGETELPGAVRYAIRSLRQRFRVMPFAARVLDLAVRNDVPQVEQRLRGIDVRL